MGAAPKGWPSIWLAPHRPLFLLAGLSALVAPAVWLLPEGIGPDKIAWHRHELLFGMAGAAAGGYLLTALPAWTKIGPVSPGITKLATLLWCLARLTAALSPHLPDSAAAIGASAYFVFVAGVLSRGVVSCRAWRRIWAPLAMTAIGAHSVLLLRADIGGFDGAGQPQIFLILIILIGGRAIPAFTRSWLDRSDTAHLLQNRPKLSYAAIAGVVSATCLGAANQQEAGGLSLLFSGTVLLAQMRGWQCLRSRRYPALFVLHLAFAWTPAALLLCGFAALFPERLPPADALHAVTMGAMGTMMAALMMRAAMVRKAGRLELNGIMISALALITLSTLIRVQAGWIDTTYFDPIVAAAACWMSAWAFFLVAYLPALSGSVPRPVLSADRAKWRRN